ncbi:ribonuclease H2, subunit B [Aspergillus pseudonomiae]|uniref:Ribonuclease H2 subunit B n=1 Tax=Aspergillus pseudonomiae TaxID=1506151 RepID=A0A5N7CXG4_9EURO|nr:ribonuclease H2, subunit B [Aspergillus pseudonomiae]KAE8398880.1 ribonuclease H2, subunit B [Aspergillus pseudonomiae]
MRTRSSAPSSEQSKPDQPSKPPLTTEKPGKTFILPSSASDQARFLQLPNPQTGELTRYYFCPQQGIYEFTAVTSSSQSPRSVLFTPKAETSTASDGKQSQPGNATVAKTAQLLIATPIDVVFFLIPLLCPTSSQAKGLFQPLDDIIDSQDDLPKHFRHVLYDESFRTVLQARAEAICDSVEAGDEKMFRFSEAKLLRELIAKAERMVALGLPASMEERFIRQALSTPLMAVKREDASTNAASSGTTEGEAAPLEDKETPATTASSTSVPTPSDVSTPATEVPPNAPAASDDVARLLRISTALAFMKDSYLSAALRAKVDELLSSSESPIDFKPMHDHLKHVAELRAEALASRSLGDFSRKRDIDDDEGAESRAEKKRRKEEEEKKKKAGESRGVRDLKKVNTTGMKKMSDFFSKAAAKKKS